MYSFVLAYSKMPIGLFSSRSTSTSTSLSAPASPRATEPNTAACATPSCRKAASCARSVSRTYWRLGLIAHHEFTRPLLRSAPQTRHFTRKLRAGSVRLSPLLPSRATILQTRAMLQIEATPGMLTAYLDESSDDRVYVVAGFVARDALWTNFSTDWRTASWQRWQPWQPRQCELYNLHVLNTATRSESLSLR